MVNFQILGIFLENSSLNIVDWIRKNMSIMEVSTVGVSFVKRLRQETFNQKRLNAW